MTLADTVALGILLFFVVVLGYLVLLLEDRR